MSESGSEKDRERALYPELEHEDLRSLVRRLVADAGYPLDNLTEGHVFRVGDRFSQVSSGSQERLFLFDLWSKGVCYGSGLTHDPRAMAEVIGAFVIGRMTIDEVRVRFPWFRFDPRAREHEAGRLVDARWSAYLEGPGDVAELLRPLVRACARKPRLRSLFPFTSHEVLLFSRTTGYPYDSMAACARPVYEPSSQRRPYRDSFVPGLFEVYLRDVREPTEPASSTPGSLGKKDAEWAAATLEREVPAAWQGAIDGTKDDIAPGG